MTLTAFLGGGLFGLRRYLPIRRGWGANPRAAGEVPFAIRAAVRCTCEQLERRCLLDAPQVLNAGLNMGPPCYEGAQDFSINLLFEDPDHPGEPGAIIGAVLDWGDGTEPTVYSSYDFENDTSYYNFLPAYHVYDDDSADQSGGVYTVNYTFTDVDDEEGQDSFQVEISNRAPTATMINNGPINEGGTVTVELVDAYDPSGIDTATTFQYLWGLDLENLQPRDHNYSDQHYTLNDSGTVTVYGRIGDKDDGFNTYSTNVTVVNVAPYATMVYSDPDSSGNVTVSLTNPTDPGASDTFKYSFSLVYNNLAANYSSAGTSASAVFSESQLASGAIVFARILDNDGGIRNYSRGTTAMSAVPASSSQTNLTWPDDVEDELGWRVQYSSDGASFTDYVNLSANLDHYEAINLADGARKWWRVRAYSGQGHTGESIYSPKMGATTYLPTATGITVTNVGNTDQIHVEWTAPATVHGYSSFTINVYRGDEDISPSSLITTVEVDDTVAANSGATSHEHDFYDTAHAGTYNFAIMANGGDDGTASPESPPEQNAAEVASVWQTVRDTTSNGDDLVELGLVGMEEFANGEFGPESVVFGDPHYANYGGEVVFYQLPPHTKAMVWMNVVGPGESDMTARVDGRDLKPIDGEFYNGPSDPWPFMDFTAGSVDFSPTAVFGHSRSTMGLYINVTGPEEQALPYWNIVDLKVYIYGPPQQEGYGGEPPVPDDNDDYDPPPPDEDPIIDPPPDDPPDDGDPGGPDPEDDEGLQNAVNLVIGGWEGFWTQYGYPYGDASTIETYGLATQIGTDPPEYYPGNPPPLTESVFIPVNNGFDEGNTDEYGDPVADNEADAYMGDHVNWNVAGMWLATYSTDYHDEDHDGKDDNPGTFSLDFDDSKVMVWYPDPESDPEHPQWKPIGAHVAYDLGDWQTMYEGSDWHISNIVPFLVEGIAPSTQPHDVPVTAIFAKAGLSAEDTGGFTVLGSGIDVATIEHNEVTGVLNANLKKLAERSAWLPVNDDDDDYSATATDLGSDLGQTGFTDDDLLPIIIEHRAAETGVEWRLDFNRDVVRVYTSSDKTQEVARNTAISISGENDLTLYVEGRSIGNGTIRLMRWQNGRGVEADRVAITVFRWKGALNVPEYGQFRYTVDNPGNGQWTTPEHGQIVQPTPKPSDVEIKWGSGPEEGKAIYQANADYIWDLGVNIVQVVVEAPTGQAAFTAGTVADGAVSGEYKLVDSRGQANPGLSWNAKVTFNGAGPNGDRGIKQMRAGFVQNLVVTAHQGKYGDNLTVATSSLQGNTYWDTKPSPFNAKFYSNNGAAFFDNPTPTQNAKTISENDSPWGGPKTSFNGGTLRYINLQWDLKLYVVALTRDTRNAANDIYTAGALGSWTFNGTGSVNHLNGNYPWTGANGVAGITLPQAWVALNDGTRPKTDGSRFNDALTGQTWS